MPTYHLQCDVRGPNCTGVFDDHRYNEKPEDIRGRAEKYGWSVPTPGFFRSAATLGKDVCPECQKTMVADKAKV